ncbi:OTU deubiquitinase with linear linkage specificity a [Poecilia reticulata]|uniref:OTU deubiquitinase with linear linkage specificity a n=1 Tax=Poecilia reticulata TaxID=8081 RepID=A0A3P9NIX0_POERE|nr:PREDICTED: yae1 domain-containing protein 1 [Poecilia reticulata]
MSWVKAASFNAEDVFDENADDLYLQSKEWASNMKKRIKDGYVDGVNAGEEASLQRGFNMGFREGAARTVAVGRLRGIVSAVWCWYQIQHPEKPVPSRLIDLLQQVTQHEEGIIDGIRKTLENPPPSVSDVSESMEDLEVKPAGCEETDCCRSEQKMDLDGSHNQQNLLCESGCAASGSAGGLDLLVQRCIDVASELELPQELISHIEELRNM